MSLGFPVEVQDPLYPEVRAVVCVVRSEIGLGCLFGAIQVFWFRTYRLDVAERC